MNINNGQNQGDNVCYRLLDEANDGILIISSDSMIMYANKKAASLLGYTPEAIMNLDPSELFHPETKQYIIKMMSSRFAHENVPDIYETAFITAEGNKLPVELSARVIDLDGNQADLILFRDISKRKAAENAHLDSELRYRLLVDNIPDVIWTTDEHARTTYISANVEQVYGFTPEEIYADSEELWLGRIHPDDIGRVEKSFKEMMAQEIPYDVEYRIKRKDGEWIWLHDRGILKYTESGVKYVYGIFADITEYKKIQETLIESEEKFRWIINHSFQLTGLLTPDGRLVVANEAALDFAGAKMEEVADQYFWDTPWWTQSEEDRKKIKAAVERASKGEFVRFKVTEYDRSGNIHTLDFSLKPLRGSDGEIKYLIPEGRDISDIMETQAALTDSDRRYHLLFESASDAIFIIQDEIFIDCNESTLDLFECERADIIGTPPYVFSPEKQPDGRDSKEKAREKIYSALDGKHEFFEWKHKTKDGRLFDVEVSLNVFTQKGSKYLFAVLRDISDRKKTEQALQDTRNRLEMAISMAGMHIFEYDIRAQTIIRSQQWWDLMGYEEDELKSMKDWFDIIHPDDRERVEQLIKDVIRDKTYNYDTKYRMRAKSGEYRWVYSRGKVVDYDREGRALRALGITMDITAQKIMEEEKEQLESQLRQAQKMEAIGTLAGGIAHDFNNILAVVLGNIDYSLLAKDELSPDIREALEDTLQASQRARDLVKQILTFSRKTESEKQPLKVSLILKEVLKLLRASLPSTIDIVQNISTSDKPVFADPTQIHQVIMNLCTNAAHTMRDGGILTVSLENAVFDQGEPAVVGEILPGYYIVMTVKDTGEGIPENFVERIFEPYFTTKEQSEGTGLGLAVVHGIIKDHSGAIRVESEKGSGSTLTVYLPVHETEEVHKNTETGYAESGSGRILLIDDEELMLKMMSNILRQLGYEPVLFENSMKALEFFKSEHESIDAVITDLTMPRMTGIEIAAAFKKINPEIPIILITGYYEIASRSASDFTGICSMLTKPVTIGELSATLRNTLKS